MLTRRIVTWLGRLFKQLHRIAECLEHAPGQRDADECPGEYQLDRGLPGLICVYHSILIKHRLVHLSRLHRSALLQLH
jgi:hypothetical protein